MWFLWLPLLVGMAGIDERVEQRSVLKFLCKSGLTPIECWWCLHPVFQDATYSKKQVQVWHRCFFNGLESTKDAKRCGRPRSVRTQEGLDHLSQCLQQDRRQTVAEMSSVTGIKKSSLHTMLKKDMKLSKLCPKFIPRILTDEQKRCRMAWSQENLDDLGSEQDMLSRIITGDESWMSVFELESKQGSSQWLPKGRRTERPMKALRQRSVKKSMFTAFWDEKGLVLGEFTPPGGSVTADSYCALLGRLKEQIRRRRPHLWRLHGDWCNFLLHQDNAPAHVANITLALFGESKILLLAHPPYSPDLAPSDYFLFPCIKNNLRGHKFQNLQDMRTGVLRTIRSIPQEQFMIAIRTLPFRWMKCVKAKGEYFEGHHLEVSPEDFGLEMYWEGSEDEDSDVSD